MCDTTNHKSNGLGPKTFNEFCKYIVYILDDIIVLYYQMFYNIADCEALMHPPNAKVVFGNITPLLMLHLTSK